MLRYHRKHTAIIRASEREREREGESSVTCSTFGTSTSLPYSALNFLMCTTSSPCRLPLTSNPRNHPKRSGEKYNASTESSERHGWPYTQREREMSVFIMDTHIHTHTYIEDRQTERERGGEKVCFLSETNW